MQVTEIEVDAKTYTTNSTGAKDSKTLRGLRGRAKSRLAE